MKSLFDVFKRRSSAPVARDRLQVLLAYERNSRNQPDLVSLLRGEILAVIAKHVHAEEDDLRITMERGDKVSTLEIDVTIRNDLAAAH